MNSRRALAGLLAILPLGALLVAASVLPPPERVPVHWSGRRPDGWASGAGLLTGAFTVAAVTAIVAAGAGLLQRAVPQAWSRWVVAAAGAVGWGAVAIYALTVWRTGVDGPQGVGDGWALLGIVLGLVAGVLVYAVHGRRSPTEAELRDLVPERSRVQALRGRAARPVEPWSTEVRSGLLRWLGIVVLVVMLLAAAPVWWIGESLWMALLLVVTALGTGGLALAWSHVRIGVDEDGLEVRSQVLPVRVSRIPAEQVAGADVQDLDPMRWGGIGLRALPDRTAYIIDGGPGLVVYKRDGRQLALQVTEGDPAARAGARTLLQAAGQRWAGSGSS